MKELSFHERQFLQCLFRQQGSIKYSFDEFVRRIGPLLAKWSDHGGDRVWIGNATIERQIERLLDDLHTQLVSNISNTVTDVWNLGNRKADELVTGYIKDMAISSTLKDKMFSRSADALNTLLKRKDEFGKTISSRVWDITDGAGSVDRPRYTAITKRTQPSFPPCKGCEWQIGPIPTDERLSSGAGCLSLVL